ncbi:hypothetical protein [Nocardia farcinica]|uniref:hypothetical protein n=1 Tax=Nocardia farcinica TaxID=37329 RepID=UPI0024569923|nr:hypothetical protein [Nocardia farcinica]
MGAFDDAAGRRVDSTTVGEVAASAGWSAGWDRVIYLNDLTTDATLTRKAGDDVHLDCFTGLPRGSGNSDLPGSGVTVFMTEGRPVQAVWWNDLNPSLRFGNFLLPDTPIGYDANTGAMREK